MRDRHLTRTGDDYANAFSQSLPNGLAWPREPTSLLMRAVKALAQIWGYVEQQASLLLERESDPRITINMLEDWERNWGLPDPCFYKPSTPPPISERQTALVQRMTIEGGASRAFFIEQAAEIGYTITITEFRSFIVGMDRCGDNRTIGTGAILKDDYGRIILNDMGAPVGNTLYSEYPYELGLDCRFYFIVHVNTDRLTWFRCGEGGGQAGVDHHLEIGTADDLECLIKRWAPAHSTPLFDYSGLTTPGSLSGTP